MLFLQEKVVDTLQRIAQVMQRSMKNHNTKRSVFKDGSFYLVTLFSIRARFIHRPSRSILFGSSHERGGVGRFRSSLTTTSTFDQ